MRRAPARAADRYRSTRLRLHDPVPRGDRGSGHRRDRPESHRRAGLVHERPLGHPHHTDGELACARSPKHERPDRVERRSRHRAEAHGLSLPVDPHLDGHGPRDRMQPVPPYRRRDETLVGHRHVQPSPHPDKTSHLRVEACGRKLESRRFAYSSRGSEARLRGVDGAGLALRHDRVLSAVATRAGHRDVHVVRSGTLAARRSVRHRDGDVLVRVDEPLVVDIVHRALIGRRLHREQCLDRRRPEVDLVLPCLDRADRRLHRREAHDHDQCGAHRHAQHARAPSPPSHVCNLRRLRRAC